MITEEILREDPSGIYFTPTFMSAKKLKRALAPPLRVVSH